MKRGFYLEVMVSLLIWVIGLGSLSIIGIRLLHQHQRQQTLFKLSATMERMKEALNDGSFSYEAEFIHFSQDGQTLCTPDAYRIEIERSLQDLHGLFQETYTFTLLDAENREQLRLRHVRGQRDE